MSVRAGRVRTAASTSTTLSTGGSCGDGAGCGLLVDNPPRGRASRLPTTLPQTGCATCADGWTAIARRDTMQRFVPWVHPVSSMPLLILDESLIQRLPLPLALLYRRAHNAKTPLERCLTAFYLWEASVKLLSSCASRGLRGIRRPRSGTGAASGEPGPAVAWGTGGSSPVCSFPRWPNAAIRPSPAFATCCWDAAATTAPAPPVWMRRPARTARRQGRDAHHRASQRAVRPPGASAERGDGTRRGRTAQRTELPASWAWPAGRAWPKCYPGWTCWRAAACCTSPTFACSARATGWWNALNWLARRPRRLESLEVPREHAATLPRPGRLYSAMGGSRSRAGGRCIRCCVYNAEAGHVLFLNSRRGQARADYLCYTTGEVVRRDELGGEQRELLAQVLGATVEEKAAAQSGRNAASAEGPPERIGPACSERWGSSS